MSEYTKGPWHIGLRTAHSKRDVYGERGELIALADAVFTDLATAQANARLIAASPDLLRALKGLLRETLATMEEEEQGSDAIADAVAAIAKAEGRG